MKITFFVGNKNMDYLRLFKIFYEIYYYFVFHLDAVENENKRLKVF